MTKRTPSLAVAVLVCAAVLLGAVSALAADLPQLNFENYTLPNGLQVILYEDHSTPIVAVNTWYHVGSKNERPGRTGFAHLFEHMMFQGSEHQDDDYFGPLQEVGGILNGSTSEDRTNYWEVVPANHLERAILMEADRMGWLLPAMTEEKFKNQQDVVRNERRQSEGRPYAVFWLNANENIYPQGHPYDHSVIGSHQDLEAATLDDVKDFFRTYYTPNNATLCIAGDFDPVQTKQWIEEYYGEIPPGPPVAETRVWVPTLTHEKWVRLEDRVQLARLNFVWPSAAFYRPGDAELDLAGKILGQGKTSRLYRRLVHDEKLAQDASAWQEGGQISSIFNVQVTLKPGVTVAQVKKAVDEELARFAQSGPTDEELTRAKNDFEASFVKGLQRVGSWGGIGDRLNRYNHYVGTPDYLEQDYARYMDATGASVRDAFNRWIGPGRVVFETQPTGKLAAGPAAEVDRTQLPAGGPTPGLTLPDLHTATGANGLTVKVMEQHELPLVQVELVIPGGTATDPAGKAGLADLTGDMLQEGTARMDGFEFASALEELGTDLRVSTAPDYITLSLTTLTKHLDASMELLADALLHPAFPAGEFERMKEERILNARREAENPYLTAAKVGQRILYGPDHPYGHRGTGTEASLEAITLDDVKDYARTHFTPARATLILVGDLDLATGVTAAENHLGDWQGAAAPAPDFPEPTPRTRREVYLVDKPGDSQSTISIVDWGLARNDPDWTVSTVANRILGGFFSSRLNMNLREDKGFTYGARSRFGENVHPGAFTMGARVQTEVTAPALTEFMKELEGIHGAEPVTPEEVAFAENSIVLAYPGDFETNYGIARALAEVTAFGLPEEDITTFPERVQAVDAAALNAAAGRIFHPDRVAVVVVGDLSRIEDPVRALELGPVHILDSEGKEIERAEAGGGSGSGAR